MLPFGDLLISDDNSQQRQQQRETLELRILKGHVTLLRWERNYLAVSLALTVIIFGATCLWSYGYCVSKLDEAAHTYAASLASTTLELRNRIVQSENEMLNLTQALKEKDKVCSSKLQLTIEQYEKLLLNSTVMSSTKLVNDVAATTSYQPSPNNSLSDLLAEKEHFVSFWKNRFEKCCPNQGHQGRHQLVSPPFTIWQNILNMFHRLVG